MLCIDLILAYSCQRWHLLQYIFMYPPHFPVVGTWGADNIFVSWIKAHSINHLLWELHGRLDLALRSILPVKHNHSRVHIIAHHQHEVLPNPAWAETEMRYDHWLRLTMSLHRTIAIHSVHCSWKTGSVFFTWCAEVIGLLFQGLSLCNDVFGHFGYVNFWFVDLRSLGCFEVIDRHEARVEISLALLTYDKVLLVWVHTHRGDLFDIVRLSNEVHFVVFNVADRDMLA